MIMIRVNEEYLIQIDGNTFAVMGDMHEARRYRYLGCYSTLEAALRGLMHVHREMFAHSPKNAVTTLRQSENALVESIRAAFPDKRIGFEERRT